MPSLGFLFVAVFCLNLAPAFAPPTWMLMSWLGLNYPQSVVWQMVLVAAIAATLGRAAMARGARWLLRARILNEDSRHNIDALKQSLEKRQALTIGLFLTYAFSPLPSNFLFIAYGLSNAPIWILACPFFVGRLASYTLWIFLGQQAALHVVGNGQAAEYLGGYFILTQLAVLASLYVFVKLDWVALIGERRLRWRHKPKKAENL